MVVSLPPWVLETEPGPSLTVVVVLTLALGHLSSLMIPLCFLCFKHESLLFLYHYHRFAFCIPCVSFILLAFFAVFATIGSSPFPNLIFQPRHSVLPWSIGKTFTDFVLLIPGIGDWLSFSISVSLLSSSFVSYITLLISVNCLCSPLGTYSPVISFESPIWDSI